MARRGPTGPTTTAETRKRPKENSSKWSVDALATARLKASGITSDEGARLGIVPLDPAKTSELDSAYLPLPALFIPYYLSRDEPLIDRGTGRQFHRVRYLASPNDFSAVTKKAPPRYAQPTGSGVAAYLPRVVDWAAIAADAAQPILLTEGELKAAKATLAGFPCVGLGGVDSFRSARLGLEFLPELDAFVWRQRVVWIAYDSDARTNPNVCRAVNALAEELAQRGADPRSAVMPQLGDAPKTGLDDFLVAQPPKALRAVLAEADPLTLARSLWGLNKQVVYVRDPGLVIDTTTGQKISPSVFKESAFATESYPERVLKADGSVSLKRVPAAAAWLKWPLRHEVRGLTYAPGRDRSYENGTGRVWNTWTGWGVEPKKGDVRLFVRLLDHLFTGAEPAARRWFEQWLAWPLQHPGTKLFTAAVLHGVHHGTGKSLVGYTMRSIYGRNFAEITQHDLHSSFNEWAESKQFVLGDDVLGSNKRQDADALKKMITQVELRVNPKYVASYVVPDCINYLFTSNHPDAFFLEDDDRRFFVHEVSVDPLTQDFYAEYDAWYKGDGTSALFHHLLRLDLSGFNPAAPAFKTAARARMIADAKSDLAAWVERLLIDPDGVLRAGKVPLDGDLFTSRQLLSLYDPTGTTQATANGLGRELKRAGIFQVLDGRTVRTASGFDRYYAIRNRDVWRTANHGKIVTHLAAPPSKKEAKF